MTAEASTLVCDDDPVPPSKEPAVPKRAVPKVVAFEDDEDSDESVKLEDVIPGPPSPRQFKSNNTGAELDLSLTEHHIKGTGILASKTDLRMPFEEFAAGCNLLQAAARNDLPAVKQLLLSHPQHVNFRDYDRRTALHVAASEGHLRICRYLVEKKNARVNRSDRWGGSPLDDAHRHRQDDVVKFLRENGATTGSVDMISNLITASAEGDLDEVRLLLSFGIAINEGDYDKRTALHLASGEGHANIVQLLLKNGADPNVCDRWGGRPLDDAIRNQHEGCVAILKKYGAQPGMIQEEKEEEMDESRQDDNLRVEFSELEMIERIGVGAFGEIYKCRWRGTLVAAKCIKSAKIQKEFLSRHALAKASERNGEGADEAIRLLDEADMSKSAKAEALSDFRQEIRVLKACRHPNICLLLAYSTTKDYEVMISELMKCSLLDIFKSHMIQGTRIPRRRQIMFAQQLALGMNYLHTCKPPVIHRDLKPANLLVDHSGVLKISDFGLAKVRPDPKTNEQDTYLMTGETGSYRFMAPEVFRHEVYNETVDVYSYAMIFFYLLGGRPPWPTLNGIVAVEKASTEGERPPIPRDWDMRLSRLLQQCWDENPQARPSFAKILIALGDYSRDVFKTDANSVDGSNTPMAESNCCIIL